MYLLFKTPPLPKPTHTCYFSAFCSAISTTCICTKSTFSKTHICTCTCTYQATPFPPVLSVLRMYMYTDDVIIIQHIVNDPICTSVWVAVNSVWNDSPSNVSWLNESSGNVKGKRISGIMYMYNDNYIQCSTLYTYVCKRDVYVRIQYACRMLGA